MSKIPVSPHVQRIRHPLKARRLQVRRIAPVTPRMLRVTFHGPDLADFVSASFDDHIKLFFPADGQPVMPEASDDGVRFAEGVARPAARDYTPRRFRQAGHELDIDFLLHGDGPASSWASHAQVGDLLIAAGPRGSFIIPDTVDWQLLIGDETALPAIMRRLEEAAEGCQIHVLALVHDEGEHQPIETRANAHVHWVCRNTFAAGGAHADPLLAAVQAMPLPAGQGYVWAAGEAAHMRALHQHLSVDRGIDKTRLRISNYWKRDTGQSA